MRTYFLVGLALAAAALSQTPPPDISGTWIIKIPNPMMGEVEIVFDLKVDPSGKITGMQKMPFGDSPIVDGKITGDQVELVVEGDTFGTATRATIKAAIVPEGLQITMPEGMGGRGGRGPGGPPAGAPPPGPPPAGGAGRGRGRGGMFGGTFVAKRGTPTPSYRAATVNYATLPKVDLPR